MRNGNALIVINFKVLLLRYS